MVLQDGLAAAQAIYGKQYNPVITLKSLFYFAEGDVAELSQAVRDDLAQAVRRVRVEALPVKTSFYIIGEGISQQRL